MDHYPNSQFDSFRWKAVHSEFSESWINEWEIALSASCPHSEGEADLCLTAPERAPWPPAQQLWEGLGVEHFKVYSVSQWNQKTQPLYYHSLLCPSSTLLSSATPLIRTTELCCSGFLCGRTSRHIRESSKHSKMTSVPQVLPAEGKKADVHYVAKSTFCTTSFCMRGQESSLLAACLSSFFSKHLCL